MGVGNTAVAQWMRNKERFADLFNGIVFQGEQVVLPEELELTESESAILVEDKDKKLKNVQRYRDIVMHWKQGTTFVLLACENQSKVHYAMPVRNMLYDSLSYAEQCKQIWQNGEREKSDMTEEEFLSKFRKNDKIYPVITLVFYYDVKEWDASVSLYEMLDIDEKEQSILREYLPDYKINVVDANKIEHLERFKSDLQEIFGMLKYRKRKNELREFMNEHAAYFRSVDNETYQAIREFLHSERLVKATVKIEEREGSIDMCKAIEDIYQEGVDLGIEQGMEKAIELLQELGHSCDVAVQKVMSKFGKSYDEATQYVAKYWKD